MKQILFSASMVRAILDGRKTMTRRAVKLRPCEDAHESDDGLSLHAVLTICGSVYEREIKPRYQPGDILWVRETWGCYANDWNDSDRILYRADYADRATGYWFEPEQINWCDLPKWRPSIYMPREAARLFLRVTDVRVERVQEISEDDAWREGVAMDDALSLGCTPDDPAKCVFSGIWDSLNAKRGFNWDVNPWAWVYSFDRIGKEEAKGGGVQCAGK